MTILCQTEGIPTDRLFIPFSGVAQCQKGRDRRREFLIALQM